MLLLTAVIKTLKKDVFTFPETPYTPIIICTFLPLQAEWTSVPPNADRRITLLENFPRTLPGIEPGTSTVAPLAPECHVLSTIPGKYDRKTNTRTY
jgi:hypothetical protein